jgi:hypothetical protein
MYVCTYVRMYMCMYVCIHVCDHLLIPIWKGVRLGDSVLWELLPPIVAGLCFISEAALFYWQRIPVRVPLPVWVRLSNLNVSCSLCLSSPWPLPWPLQWRSRKLLPVSWTVVQIPFLCVNVTLLTSCLCNERLCSCGTKEPGNVMGTHHIELRLMLYSAKLASSFSFMII